MAATERITMTMRELDRFKVIQDVADGKLKPWPAAERLELTTRQVRRLGRDPGRADGDRRHLRDELPVHARTALAVRLFRRGGRDRGGLRLPLLPLQALQMALSGRSRRHP